MEMQDCEIEDIEICKYSTGVLGAISLGFTYNGCDSC